MPLSTVLGAQSLVQPAVCTTATRPASPYTGQAIYDTTTATQLIWNGTAWVGTGGGLVCVKAETAFTTSAAVNVDNVFTSTYTNYLVHFSLVSSATNDIGFRVRLRASGTDTSSSNYYYGLSGATQAAGAVTDGAAAATSFNLGDIGNIFTLSPLTFGSPQVAARTSLYATAQEAATNTTNNRAIQSFGGFLDVATQYDGFTVFPSSGTITGSYIVYGYSKAV